MYIDNAGREEFESLFWDNFAIAYENADGIIELLNILSNFFESRRLPDGDIVGFGVNFYCRCRKLFATAFCSVWFCDYSGDRQACLDETTKGN